MAWMTRLAPAFALVFVALGCAGSSTPVPSAPDPAPAAAAPTNTAPAAATSAAPAAEGWEGEGEAKGAAAPAEEAKPAPAAGAKQPEETRTVEVIAKIIKEHRAEIRAQCYEPARKDLPSLQGDMVIHLVLDPAGKVKVIELNQERSTLKSPAVVDCAIGLMKRITFPPSSRGFETVVNYPFNFMPGGPAQR
jgi:hypothetical protein